MVKLTRPAKSQELYHTRNIVCFREINPRLPIFSTFFFYSKRYTYFMDKNLQRMANEVLN